MADAIRTAVIQPDTNLVVNVIEADPDFGLESFILIASDGAGVGDTYDPYTGGFTAAGPAPAPVPASVTNFQARAVMRQTILPDGRSLLTAVNDDLAAKRASLADRPDSDEEKIAAEIQWQAWEQANEYLRNGPLVMSLAAKYGFSDATTDDLFRQASQVIA